MVLYSADCVIGLSDFGIQIPSRYDKARRIFEHLMGGPLAGFAVEDWHRAPAGNLIGKADLLRVHEGDYVERLYSPGPSGIEAEVIKTFELVGPDGGYHRYDPASAKQPFSVLFQRVLRLVSGTYECGLAALEDNRPGGFAFFLGGGMHHAMPDRGEGFCLVNDICIALRRLQADGRIRTAWVVDVDAHKGDGTAVITAADPSIHALSIHMGRGWPLDAPEYDDRGRPNPSWTPSRVEIPIFEGEEGIYLDKLAAGMEELARCGPPDLVYVVDGADPYEHDELPSTALLRLTLDQLYARDRYLYDYFQSRGIPSAWIMAGGYGERAWEVHVRFLGQVLPERLRAVSTEAP